MTDVTNILGRIEEGDPSAAEKLLPLVYEELRKLASQKLQQEKSGQTLQATALVHEAYLRLVGPEDKQNWSGRKVAANDRGIDGPGESYFESQVTNSSSVDALRVAVRRLGEAFF
jgi:hypothetical protein